MPRSIRPYLEYQADRVEAVLAAHRAPGRITGGTVGPQLIRFFLNPAPHIRYATVKRLADDLALAMRVPALSVNRGKEGVILEFAHPNPRAVYLRNLIDEVSPLPMSSAILGLTANGEPLLARLAAPEVSHILVSGTTGSGKSALLRTIAASLVLGHMPNLLHLVCIDPKGRTFPAFTGVSHLVRSPITQVAEAVEALHSLVRILEHRDARGERPGRGVPRIVVFIDELADLIMQGDKSITDSIIRLAQRGREAGIHLVAATQHPAAAILTGLMKANFPLRLIGKVTSADDARIASGRAGTNAHLLSGRGDFLAISGGDAPVRFQVAFIQERDLKDTLSPVVDLQPLHNPPTFTRDEGGNLIDVTSTLETCTDRPATLIPVEQPRHILEVDSVPTSVQKAVVYLQPAWDRIRDAYHKGEINKSRVCRLIWENATGYNGCWQRWLDSAVELLDTPPPPPPSKEAVNQELSKASRPVLAGGDLKAPVREVVYAAA